MFSILCWAKLQQSEMLKQSTVFVLSKFLKKIMFSIFRWEKLQQSEMLKQPIDFVFCK